MSDSTHVCDVCSKVALHEWYIDPFGRVWLCDDCFKLPVYVIRNKLGSKDGP